VGCSGDEVSYYAETVRPLPSSWWTRHGAKCGNRFRRAFVLIDSQHGPKASDLMLLESLGRQAIPYQIVLSKVDRTIAKYGSLQKPLEDIKYLLDTGVGGVSGLGEVIGVSSLKNPKVGISELRWSIMVACGWDTWKEKRGVQY
jgi:GTP-binding protein